jgi:hypothetical protein
MASNATLGLHRGMFVNERSLFVPVAFNAGSIGAGGQSRLFQFKPTVRVVAIAAAHCALENFMMIRQVELVLYFRVTSQAKLWLAQLQQFYRREARLFSVCARNKGNRAGEIASARERMGRMAISTADIIAPVLSAPEIVVFFFAGVAFQASLRRVF